MTTEVLNLKRPLDVLLVEDDADDILLMKECFKKSRFPLCFHITRNGVDAMAFLRKEEVYRQVPRPDLILLDLKMPVKDGRSTLAEIKQDSQLHTIPVLILTTSRDDQDRIDTYYYKANFYLVKPSEMDEMEGMVNYIDEFWFKDIVQQSQKPFNPPDAHSGLKF